ncbi:hypothetical protein [Duncaniella dubosii]|uniref:hypothetical protein n=1 Tax=Duncaniella dubosii TaxID=2518971 RepID=UPI003F66417D
MLDEYSQVVSAFVVELALSLKFLFCRGPRIRWHILDREAFLALWIVCPLLGLYLLGQFKFAHYGKADSSSCFSVSSCSLLILIHHLPYPGLWGALSRV